MEAKGKFEWLIAYVDVSTIGTLKKDLKKSNQFSEIEAVIPVIKILKKKFKKESIFDEVPLLFNYGFFKIPYLWAINPDLLKKLQDDISCISGWVKDPACPLSKIACARVDEETIDRLCQLALDESIHSSSEIERIKPGDIITLHGYPFEDMEAMVVEVKKKSKSMMVDLNVALEDGEETQGRIVEVSFDNVFYSIYKGSYSEDYSPGHEKPLEKRHLNTKEAV